MCKHVTAYICTFAHVEAYGSKMRHIHAISKHFAWRMFKYEVNASETQMFTSCNQLLGITTSHRSCWDLLRMTGENSPFWAQNLQTQSSMASHLSFWTSLKWQVGSLRSSGSELAFSKLFEHLPELEFWWTSLTRPQFWKSPRHASVYEYRCLWALMSFCTHAHTHTHTHSHASPHIIILSHISTYYHTLYSHILAHIIALWHISAHVVTYATICSHHRVSPSPITYYRRFPHMITRHTFTYWHALTHIVTYHHKLSHIPTYDHIVK